MEKGLGEVVKVGWEKVDGYEEEQFVALVRFDEPPRLSAAVVWNKTPVKIVPQDR